MKRITIYTILAALLLTSGCENQENIFPDYKYQAVYFPIQFPQRTLSLGDNDYIDSPDDDELLFHIGISISGMYENKSDWTVDYVIDNTLADGVAWSQGDTILPIPSAYIEYISPKQTVIIPSGSMIGFIEVKLRSSFLQDSMAVKGNYVIPLRITDHSADTVLSGKPAEGVENPDRRIVSDWVTGMTPKDFTLYGIKYVNNYHGKWFHRGVDYTLDAGNQPVDTTIFHKQYEVENQVWSLVTQSLDVVYTSGAGKESSVNDKLSLTFNNGAVTVGSVQGSSITATGTGTYIDDDESREHWNTYYDGTPVYRDAIYLNYTYVKNGTNHHVIDTLVFRDKTVKLEKQDEIVVY